MCGQLCGSRETATGTPQHYCLDAQKSEVWSPKQGILHFPHCSLQWEPILTCVKASNPAAHCMCVCVRESERQQGEQERHTERLCMSEQLECRCQRGLISWSWNYGSLWGARYGPWRLKLCPLEEQQAALNCSASSPLAPDF